MSNFTRLGTFFVIKNQITHARIFSEKGVYEARIFLNIPGLRGRIYDIDTGSVVRENDKVVVSCQTYLRKQFNDCVAAGKYIEDVLNI